MQQLLRWLSLSVVVFACLYLLTAQQVPSQLHIVDIIGTPPRTGSARAIHEEGTISQPERRILLQRSSHSGSPSAMLLSKSALARWRVNKLESWDTGKRHFRQAHHVRELQQSEARVHEEAESVLVSAVQQTHRTADEVGGQS